MTERASSQTPVDFIARIAQAWDGLGRHALTPYAEHEALCAIARLEPRLSKRSWRELTPDQRRALVLAVRRAVDLGRCCAWTLGEGQGA